MFQIAEHHPSDDLRRLVDYNPVKRLGDYNIEM